MVFSSILFLFYFLPVFLAIYFLVPRKTTFWRNIVLLSGSLFFYAWGEGIYVLLLLGSICFNHLIAQQIVRHKRGRLLAFGIAFNLALIGLFKYASFLLLAFGIQVNPLHLPLGISFFTFQSISFLVDIARQQARPPRSLLETGVYIACFPQLIAGPIVRYQTIAEALEKRQETIDAILDGSKLFILGLAQKVLIANIAAQPVDQIFSLPSEQLTLPIAWAGAIAYTIQIFFDFAGYSNMAIGLGLILGFSFPRNFNYPYVAQSLTEFWRRWHMTLSQWFRDYLYIPLGGNKRGTRHTVRNLWIVFLLCGLWHGAAWTFLLWGAWHGLFLSLERLGLSQMLNQIWRPFRHLYLILVVLIGWVLFRAETVSHAMAYYGAMFGMQKPLTDTNLTIGYFFPNNMGLYLLLASVIALPIGEKLFANFTAVKPFGFVIKWCGLVVLGFLTVTFIAAGAYNPFIYFRF